MAIQRRHRRRQKNYTNHNEHHRIGVAYVEVPATQFAQQKQYAKRCDDYGTHQTPDRAARTFASGIAHLVPFNRLSASSKLIAEHVHAHTNQNQRPQPAQVDKLKDPKIIEQQ